MPQKYPAQNTAARFSGALVTGLGLVLVLATLLAWGMVGWFEYNTLLQSGRDRGELQARVLEDQATRSFDAVSTALKYLARDIEHGNLSTGPAAANQVLAQAINSLPGVRSLSIVGSSGRVLSSSTATDLGLEIELNRLGRLPKLGQEQLANFVRGRSLNALAKNGGNPAIRDGVGFIPLIFALNTTIDGDMYLVALINPDSFSSFQLLTVNNLSNAAYLTSYEGSILASSGTTSRVPGDKLVDHPVMRDYLPSVEHASYVGVGASPNKQIVAFRLSKSRPIVVVLEQPHADTLSLWYQAMRWFTMAAGLTIVFLIFMTSALLRSLRARERAHADLDAARQELQHQLAFMALLQEISPTPISTLDSAGRYLSVNRAWEEFTRRERTLVIGHTASEFLPSGESKLQNEQDERVWATGEPIRYETRVTHGDGSQRDVVINKLLIPGDERIGARILNTIMDISEFREAERASREARNAAQESSRAKSEFIANISHELRTPLQSILGFSELGLMRGTQHPKLHSMFTEINASGSRMLALVNDLLDVSKIESSVGTITPECVDVRSLVHDVIRELDPQVNAKNLALQVTLGDHPLISQIDPARFAQVIRNVMANAIKFSPPGSNIDVAGTETADGQICIRVRDQGPGIPTAEREVIFDAFVQSSKTKDGSGGTGLGLAICRKILAVQGGSISADNTPDGGAVFSIYLPAHKHLNQETAF